jgi:hypothetical protein
VPGGSSPPCTTWAVFPTAVRKIAVLKRSGVADEGFNSLTAQSCLVRSSERTAACQVVERGSTPLRGAATEPDLACSSIGTRTPDPQSGRMGSTPIQATEVGQVVEQQTHGAQNPGLLTGRESANLSLVTACRWGRCPIGFHKTAGPARYRDLQLIFAGGPVSGGGSYPPQLGATP